MMRTTVRGAESSKSDFLPPHFSNYAGRLQLFVEGKPFLFLGGEFHNSSSSSLEYLMPAWERLERLHCNGAIASVSWELLEPEEGVFDFSLVDGLLEAARAHGMRLALLWFGTWKNAESRYVPSWVKTDTRRFFRMRYADGRTSRSISCFCNEARAADARAFSALMRRLRERDGDAHTVVLVQVENETGFLGSPREYSPEANAAFSQPVPKELCAYLAAHEGKLHPELRAAWQTGAKAGEWHAAFGTHAEECFMAWHIASYVEVVACMGGGENPLPMYANAWIRQFGSEPAGSYPSGGPVDRVLDIWKAAAPSIALLAPDIYLPDFSQVCDSYQRDDNPLFVPESKDDRTAAVNAFCALGKGAAGFSAFGIDGVGFEPVPQAEKLPDTLSPMFSQLSAAAWAGQDIAAAYGLLAGLLPLLAEHPAQEMAGFVQNREPAEAIDLGGYRLRITYPPLQAGGMPGGGLVLHEGGGRFLFAGQGYGVEFFSILPEDGTTDILSAEEGHFEHAEWKPRRRLNGDEIYRFFMEDIAFARRVELYRYR